ncbi:hypothetical protein FKM82_020166 [Ascaphus truei]
MMGTCKLVIVPKILCLCRRDYTKLTAASLTPCSEGRLSREGVKSELPIYAVILRVTFRSYLLISTITIPFTLQGRLFRA